MESTQMTSHDQRLLEAITEITAELTDSQVHIAQVQEDFFVKVFLRMFAGYPFEQTRVTPQMWFNVSHGPFNEVEVLDLQGRSLFLVPAFFSQKAMTPIDGTGKSANMPTVTDMLAGVQHHAFRGAGAGDAYMLQEMQRRNFMFNPNADTSDDTRRWNEIFARYDITPVKAADTLLKQPDPNVDLSRDSSEIDSLC